MAHKFLQPFNRRKFLVSVPIVAAGGTFDLFAVSRGQEKKSLPDSSGSLICFKANNIITIKRQ